MNVKKQYNPGYDPYSSRNSLGADPEYTFGTASRTYDPEYDYGGRPTAAQREADLLALEKARLKRISDAQFTIPKHAAASVFTGSYPSKEPTGYGISEKEYNPQNLVTPVTNILPENNNQGAPWKTQTPPTQWSNVQRSGQQKNQLPQPEFVQRILGEEPFPGFWEAETPLKKPQDQWGSLQNIKSVSAAPQQVIDIGDEELFPGFHSEEELPLIRTSYGQQAQSSHPQDWNLLEKMY